MSVSITTTLPAQPGASPADGTINIIPLGGDGYEAPKSMYQGVITIAGDGSGGQQTITVNADARFQQMVSFFTTVCVAPAADKIVTWFCQPSDNAPAVFALSRLCLTTSRCGLAMVPPLIMPWTNWSVQQTNITDETFQVEFQILNYAIDCTHKVPLNVILASIPSAGQISPSI